MKDLYIQKLDYRRFVLYFGILILTFKTTCSISSIIVLPNTFDDILSISSAAILCVYTVSQIKNIKLLILYLLFISLGLLSANITGQSVILITIITIFALCSEKIDNVIKFIFYVEIIFLIINISIFVLLCLLNSYSFFKNYGGRIRCDFGFNHPNVFSSFLFNIILMWIWLNYKKITVRHYISIVIISIIAYLFSGTRTSLVLSFLTIILLFVSKRSKKSKFLFCIASVIVPLIAILIMLCIVYYTSDISIINFIDKLLSTRIRLGAYAYENFGITFFGQNLENIDVIWDPYWGFNEFTFDCSYSYLIMNNGLIWLLIIVISFYFLAKRKDNIINLFIIVWSLYAVTEIHGLNCYYCFPILLISYLVFYSNKEMKIYARKMSAS